MKKVIYALMVPLVVVSGLVFANHASQQKAEKSSPKTLPAADMEAARKAWEASPDGVRYIKWTLSPEGKMVLAGAAKIRKQVSAFSNLEAVITSLSLPAGSRLGFGVMVKIEGEEYILSFWQEEAGEFAALRNLRVGDKIVLRSRSVSHAPKYAYPIVSGDYVERDGKVIYKRVLRKGGC